MRNSGFALGFLALLSTSLGLAQGASRGSVPIIPFPPSFVSADRAYDYQQKTMIYHMERLLGEARKKIIVSRTGWGNVSTLDPTVAEPLALCIVTTELYGKADPQMEKTFSNILETVGALLVPENVLSPDRKATLYTGFGLPPEHGQIFDAPATRQTFEQFLREASRKMNARTPGYHMDMYRGLK